MNIVALFLLEICWVWHEYVLEAILTACSINNPSFGSIRGIELNNDDRVCDKLMLECLGE